jgi:hypothetical protein
MSIDVYDVFQTRDDNIAFNPLLEVTMFQCDQGENRMINTEPNFFSAASK